MKPSSLDVSLSLFSYTNPWCYQVREVMPHYYQSQLGGTDRVSTFVFPPSFTIIITTYLLMRFFSFLPSCCQASWSIRSFCPALSLAPPNWTTIIKAVSGQCQNVDAKAKKGWKTPATKGSIRIRRRWHSVWWYGYDFGKLDVPSSSLHQQDRRGWTVEFILDTRSYATISGVQYFCTKEGKRWTRNDVIHPCLPFFRFCTQKHSSPSLIDEWRKGVVGFRTEKSFLPPALECVR